MPNNMLISTKFHDLAEADPTAEMSEIMSRIGDGFGLGYFTYFALPANGRESENLVLTSYPSGWQDRYQQKNYHLIDPVISRGLGGMLPLDWAHLPRRSSLLKSFFGEAGELGVHDNGISVPIRDHLNGRALFSVNVDLSGCSWEDYRREFVADITYLAFLFHDRVMQRGGIAEDPLSRQLMPQEIEVLRWAAHGKTVWETSRIMSLSQRTITFYLANAYAKMRVANKPQAVARCVSEGLFHVTGDC